MRQAVAQAKQNNAERHMASIGMDSKQIAKAMSSLNSQGLGYSAKNKAMDAIADVAFSKDFSERNLVDKARSARTMAKVGGDTAPMAKGFGESAAESVLGLSAGMLASSVIGPLGGVLGKKAAGYMMDQARKTHVSNIAKYGVEKANEMAAEQQAMHFNQPPPGEREDSQYAVDRQADASRFKNLSNREKAEGGKEVAAVAEDRKKSEFADQKTQAVNMRQERMKDQRSSGTSSTLLTDGGKDEKSGNENIDEYRKRTRKSRKSKSILV